MKLDIQLLNTSFGDFSYQDSGSSETTLVFLHGGAANLVAWRDVVRNLDNEFRCLRIDLPAHGQSTVQQLQFTDLADAILEICDLLAVERPFLVGHSFGGLAAVSTAIKHPLQFVGVLAIDPYLSNAEVQRSHESLCDARMEIQHMDWPWKAVADVEKEVKRCVDTLYQPRRYPETLRKMVRWGYRRQDNGFYIRYPRKEDEMKGVEANWSIDLDNIYTTVPCPLSIVIGSSGLGNIQSRRDLLCYIDNETSDFESKEFDCGHDIPQLMPEELAGYIRKWVLAKT